LHVFALAKHGGRQFLAKQHYMWLDGCSSQFKNKIPWFFVNHYPFLTKGCTLLWSFFGTSHGKGPHDGARARAIQKRFIRQFQLDASSPKLQNVKDVVELLCKHLSS
jgi:hypothetical protein